MIQDARLSNGMRLGPALCIKTTPMSLESKAAVHGQDLAGDELRGGSEE